MSYSDEDKERVAEVATKILDLLMEGSDSQFATMTLITVILSICKLCGTSVPAFLGLVEEIDGASTPESSEKKSYTN